MFFGNYNIVCEHFITAAATTVLFFIVLSYSHLFAAVFHPRFVFLCYSGVTMAVCGVRTQIIRGTPKVTNGNRGRVNLLWILHSVKIHQ